MKGLKSILFLCSCLLMFKGYNQEQSCSDNLIEAQKLFQQGFLEEVPVKLQGCIEKGGFSKEELQDAYKLLIQAYLYDDRPTEADNSMLRFLKRFPEYKTTNTDPDIFKYLYGTYNTEPVFTVGPLAGFNFIHYNLKERFSYFSFEDEEGFKTNQSGGLLVGASFSKYIYKKLELELELFYNQIKFETIDTSTTFLGGPLSVLTQDLTFNQINSALSILYNYPVGKFIPYARIGGYGGSNLKVTAITRPNITGLEEPTGEIEQDDYEKYNYGLLAGIGVKWPVSRGTLIIDFRFNKGLSEYTNLEKIYYSSSGAYDYAPNQFKINTFTATIRFNFSIYKARKRKN